MKHFLLTLIYISVLANFAVAQKLSKSRRTSYYSYIYKISNAEAKLFYAENKLPKNERLFYAKIDSFPTDSSYRRELPVGHYLFAYALAGKLEYELQTIDNLDLKILNNKRDLSLILYDGTGNLVENAEIHIKSHKIPFDKKSHTYRLPKTNQSGLLAIDYQGFTSYHQITKQYKNSRFKRIKNFIIYNPPMKYILYPAFWVYWRGRDVFQTIKYGHPHGFIRTIGSIFDPNLRNHYGRRGRNRENNRGYVAFNKPMFMPNDTAKVKALILNEKGKPINQEFEVKIRGLNINKTKTVGVVKPYQSGVYAFEFVMHDSLGLRLDDDYYLSFYKKGEKNVSKSVFNSDYFRYEDYELKENKFTIRHAKQNTKAKHLENYFPDEKIALYAQGKDANDMNLLDGRVRLTVFPQFPQFEIDQVFVKDTLWVYEQKLDAIGETKIILPDSILPPISLKMKVLAEFYNASNERITQELELSYINQKERLLMQIPNDSLKADYLVNGQSQKIEAELIASANYNATQENKEIYRKKVQLPYVEKINPYITDYQLIIQKQKAVIASQLLLNSLEAQIECLTQRNGDSIQIIVENPRKIPFWYSIYRKNQVIQKGMTTQLSYKAKNKSFEKYFISIQFVWGSVVKSLDYEIPLYTRNLEVLVNQPRSIEPGQKANIEIEVKDYDQNPVENVDLTAYAFTKKFSQAQIPQLPSFEKRRKNRKFYNSFSERKIELNPRTKPLNWDFWNAEMRLDSIEYFKFLYPQSGIYWQEQANPDKITQFAPFVVRKGQIEPVHIIYVDEVPVYFRVNNTLPRYAFAIDSGYHSIKLRTDKYLIRMDKVHFSYGQKTLFSVRADSANTKIKLNPQKNAWQANELKQLDNYMLPIRPSNLNSWAYIKQQDRLQLMTKLDNYSIYNHKSYRPYSQNNPKYYFLSGPFRPSFSTEYKLLGDFYTRFDFESGFEYEFQKELLKMRTLKPSDLINPKKFYNDHSDGLSDNVLTVREIDSLFKAFNEQKKIYYEVYDNPKATEAGYGRLHFNYNKSVKALQKLKYVIILKPGISDFLRVYPPNANWIHQLPKGQYRMIFLLEKGDYFTKDSLDIQINGINFYRIEEKILHPPDSFSIKTLQIIQNRYIKYSTEPQRDLLEIKKNYNQQTQVVFPANFNNRIFGIIKEEDSGETLPGVSVFIKGTSIGTVSNAEGYYELFVDQSSILVFQAVGLVSKEIPVESYSQIDVSMEESVKMLGEVVVTGYGIETSNKLSYSISTIDSNVLQGRMLGVNVTSPIADSTRVRIRGVASVSADKRPLIIVDGQPLDGNFTDLDPNLVQKIEVLNSEKAMAIYGAKAINGVIIITTTNQEQALQKQQQIAESTNEPASVENSLRRNFSDYAYWQPKLRTDKQGKARFNVTFPDDITNWRTVVLATDAHKRSGQAEGEIKAFKSLSANLAVPRFLVQGDSTQVIGKSLNYTEDTLAVQTSFVVDGKERLAHNQQLTTSIIDSIWVQAESADSLEIKYFLKKQDGYSDGELRKIPIYAQGVEETEGSFYTLDKDTVLNLRFSDKYGAIKLYAEADVLEVILNETRHLRNYRYLCNEQTASKIKALLAEKRICEYLQREFRFDKDIRFLINKLEKNQKDEGAWGWWDNTEAMPWVSIHIVEALTQAQKAGYRVKIEQQKFFDYLVYQIEKINHSEKLKCLQILSDWKANVNYAKYIQELEAQPKLSLYEKLSLWHLRQKQNLPLSIDSVLKYRQITLWGNHYWGILNYEWYDNSVQNTLLAYQILKLKGNHEADLRKMRNYFFEIRKNACWRNTYESAQIIEVILPDLLGDDRKIKSPQLAITGAVNQKVEKFPFSMQLPTNQAITINKKGDFPIYLTTHQSFWNENPEKVEKDLIVNTYFDTKTNQLKAGKPVKLIIEVEVKKSAEYLMLEVPIPAGCSYNDKKQTYYWGGYEHREYAREKTNFYFTFLGLGTYKYEIELLPRYSGKYTLNPAKIEQMYFPTFFGRNEKKRVEIK